MLRTIVWGLIITGFGLWIWLGNLGVISQIWLKRDWPVIIVIIGLLTIAGGISRYFRKRR